MYYTFAVLEVLVRDFVPPRRSAILYSDWCLSEPSMSISLLKHDPISDGISTRWPLSRQE